MGVSDFVIAHISDLHFSEGTDKLYPDHQHSIEHLRCLEDSLLKFEIDFLILSGDISNYGDRQSLINASGFIFNSIPIGEEEIIGLRLPSQKVGIVPGNHDAWNCPLAGSLNDRRQKSLENFSFSFPSYSPITTDGCYYQWLQKGKKGIFIAFVDSCFLGGTEKNDGSAFGTMRLDQAIAKGKLSVAQTEKLLEWHDLGMKGELPSPHDNETYIEKDVFGKSLKIIVMHHYLFEPPQHKTDYFMRIQHRDVVFRNIAFSDFDILLCGHKHIPSFDTHSYGYHFDKRAKNRLMINYFRRLIGLHSLPVQIEDQAGRRWSKLLTFLSNILIKLSIRRNPQATSKDIAEDVLSLLRNGLDNPDNLQRNVKAFLQKYGISGSEVLSTHELNEIKKRIAIGLTISERKKLKETAKVIKEMVKQLDARPFLQIMSGSTAKSCSDKDKLRSFNIIKISNEDSTWRVICERYNWDWESMRFSFKPLVQEQSFQKERIFT